MWRTTPRPASQRLDTAPVTLSFSRAFGAPCLAPWLWDSWRGFLRDLELFGNDKDRRVGSGGWRIEKARDSSGNRFLCRGRRRGRDEFSKMALGKGKGKMEEHVELLKYLIYIFNTVFFVSFLFFCLYVCEFLKESSLNWETFLKEIRPRTKPTLKKKTTSLKKKSRNLYSSSGLISSVITVQKMID